jgi:hypothetical protein
MCVGFCMRELGPTRHRAQAAPNWHLAQLHHVGSSSHAVVWWCAHPHPHMRATMQLTAPPVTHGSRRLPPSQHTNNPPTQASGCANPKFCPGVTGEPWCGDATLGCDTGPGTNPGSTSIECCQQYVNKSVTMARLHAVQRSLSSRCPFCCCCCCHCSVVFRTCQLALAMPQSLHDVTLPTLLLLLLLLLPVLYHAHLWLATRAYPIHDCPRTSLAMFFHAHD